MDAASGSAMAAKEFGSETATLEISTAIAGPATDRNPRTAAGSAATGEPENRCASSPCSKSAKWWLVWANGRCASFHEIKVFAADA